MVRSGPKQRLTVALLAACIFGHAHGLDNGLAAAPPRGFRTWNQFGIQVNQTLMQDIFRAMAARRPAADGGRGDSEVSLVDLGYTHAGVDDGWQLCGSGPTGGFHNTSGFPIVDLDKFPNLRQMTELATSLGLSAGWYRYATP
jgi:alpha-galactosidase